MNNITVAVDAMGGDHGPSVIVPACLQVLASHPNLTLVLVGDQTVLSRELNLHAAKDKSRLSIHQASQQVEMDELPASALRYKKDSSMRVAIDLVKEGAADACVSAGNTGALMATARFVLKTLPGIDRPAIIFSYPTLTNKPTRILDLGANVDSTEENLFQFAVMGSVLASAIDNIPNPKVFLLNIGAEAIKGNDQVKKAAELLTKHSPVNYCGFIEGDALFLGEADVVVCDGFVGNVSLKSSEGTARFIKQLISEAFRKNLFTMLIGKLVQPILKSVSKRIDPTQYNGATFIGLQGIVIKSHGGANKTAFMRAIEAAIHAVEKNIPQRISAEVERILKMSFESKGQNTNDSAINE